MTDPAWPAMDSTAQGFHTRLLLLAAQRRPRGVLPDDDRQWRKWLGLPAANAQWLIEDPAAVWGHAFPAAPEKPRGKKAVKAAPTGLPDVLVAVLEAAWTGDAPPAAARRSYEGWIDWLWTTRWKPQIEAAWLRIDEDVLASYPRLQAHVGQWFHPLALRLADEAATGPGAIVKPAASKPAKGKGKTKTAVSLEVLAWPWEQWTRGDGHLHPMAVEAVQVQWEALTLHDAVWRAWQAPLSVQDKQSLWDVGVGCLVQGDTPPERRAAREQLGRLVVQYGEPAVAQAVAKLALRPLPPADALPFLIGMLRTEDEGTPAERKARERRAQVAL